MVGDVDGVLIVSGVFSLHETVGLPIDIILHELMVRGYAPDWSEMFACSSASGWKPKTFLSKMSQAVRDVYPRDTADAIMIRLNALVVE